MDRNTARKHVASTSKKSPGFTRWMPRPLEQLEDRLTPAVTITNSPIWADAGPNNVSGGQVSNITSGNVIGAISALAPDLSDITGNTLYAGGVNGGVWKTKNALSASPTWTPLTDTFPSLSISTIAINPDNNQQILAGIAGTADGLYALNTSGDTTIKIDLDSRGQARGERIGALYSQDGGATWKVLNNNIGGKSVVGVAARTGYLLVATDVGLYRSTDSGVNFSLVNTLPGGGVFDLAADPGAAIIQIHSATWDAGVATVTTAANHALSIGQRVTVTGLTPTGFNGTFVVTSIPTLDSFTYNLALNPGNLGAGGTQGTVPNAIVSATWSGGLATITTATPSGAVAGESVVIVGVNFAGYNGTFVVASVLSATQFTYVRAANPGSPGSGGLQSSAPNAIAAATWLGGVATITTTLDHNVTVGENVVITGVALEGYNGRYSVTSVVSTKQFTYSLALNPGNTTTGGTQTNPANPISLATWIGGLATITTASPNGAAVGQRVVIAGVNVATFNGTFIVSSIVSPTQFTYTLATNPGGSGSGGTSTRAPIVIASATWSAGAVTITTSSPSGVQVGQTVVIAGIAPAGYNGTFTVTAVLSPTQYTYALATDPGLTTNGGSETADSNSDPLSRNRFYIALRAAGGVGGQGVFRSDDGGVTWGNVTNPLQMQIGANTTNVQIAVFNSGIITNNIVYVAVENNLPTGSQRPGQLSGSQSDLTRFDYAWANRLSQISTINWSPNQGGTWTRMDAPRTLTQPLTAIPPNFSTPAVRRENGFITVSTGGPSTGGVRHHLRSGDLVVIDGVQDQGNGGSIPRGSIIGTDVAGRDQVNGTWFIQVLDEYTFRLLQSAEDNGPASPQIATFTLTGTFLLDGAGNPIIFNGGTWRQVVGANAGERSEFFDLAVDPTNSGTVYLGTDRADPTFYASSASGPDTYTGSYWRGNRLANPTGGGNTSTSSNQWTTITNEGTNNGSAPPADSRDMIVLPNGQLVAATGGGIFRRTTPAGGGLWNSVNGNLGVSDIFSVAYDTLNNRLFAGTIDTQGISQNSTNGSAYSSVFSPAQLVNGALRGGFQDQANVFKVLVDNSRIDNSGATVNQTTRYYVGTNFGNVLQQTFDAGNNITSSRFLNFADPSSTTAPFSGLRLDTRGINANENVHIAMALNQNDPRRAIFGYNGLYEDADPSGTTPSGAIVNDVTPRDASGNVLITGHVDSLLYGGKRGGINFNQVVYMTTSTGQLWVRGEFGPSFTNLTAAIVAASGQSGAAIYSVVGDPDDYRHIYVAQGTKILESKDFGATFTDISGNLIGPETADGTAGPATLTTEIRTLAVFDAIPGTATAGDITLLAGGRGGVYRLGASPDCPTTSWSEYGQFLPNTIVQDLQLVNNQRLIAGTAGRGIWQIGDISTTINQDVTLTITGTAGADTIRVTLDPNNPSAILVTDGVNPAQSFTRGTFTRLQINSLGGADTVIIGSGDLGFVNFHIAVDGGGDVGDTLIVNDGTISGNTQVTVTDALIGGGVGDTIFVGCAQLAYSGFNTGTVDIATGNGNDTFNLVSVIPGQTFLRGGNGGDTYNYAMTQAGFSTVNVVEIVATGTDRLNITGTIGNDSFLVNPTQISLAGNVVNYSGNIEALTISGGLGDDTFTISGVSSATNTFNGDAGNDNFTFFSSLGSAVRTLNVNGGAGIDGFSVRGVDSNESVGVDITSAAGNGFFTGLRQTAIFTGLENVGFDGGTGTNAFSWRDRTNGSYGTPLVPESGVIYSATGATSGNVRVGTGAAFPTVFFNNINSSFVVDGDADRSGDRDVLTVQGFSTTGLGSGSPFNEGTSPDGSDTIVVTDQYVSITNAALGASRTVSFGTYANGAPTFRMINVRGGNEAAIGDRFTATPSLRTNIVINGMNPTTGSAGDQLIVRSAGATTRSRIPADPSTGAAQTRVAQTSDGASLGYYNIEEVTVVDTTGGSGGGGGGALHTGGFYLAGSDAGSPSRVQAFDRLTGALTFDFSPFGAFAGGIRVATGDVNGDGTPDIVVSAGPGAGPHVKIYSGIDGALLASFFAYGAGFTGGVDVAVADLNGDGFAEIITGSGPGAGPHIKVFDGVTFGEIASYYAFDPGFLGGIRVAVGDTNGDGSPDLIVGAQQGAEPRVTVFSGRDNSVLQDFFAFDPGFLGGVFVASGDVNGDGFADIIIGAGLGGVPAVSVFSGREGSQLVSFLANDDVVDVVGTVPFDGGVRVAAVDFDNNGIDDILTAKGRGTFPILRFYKVGVGGVTLIGRQQAFNSSYANGVYVGG